MNPKSKYLLIAAFTALSFTAASAATIPFAGTLSAGPTFNRPTTLTSLSAVGTAVYYTVLPFTVDTTGGYTLTLTAVGYDPYILEYMTSFNPASPLTNLINGDDDYDPDGAGPLTTLNGSQIVATGGTAAGNFANTNNLTAGVQYYFVSTSFSNAATGTFTGTADGPGITTFTVVPEPATWSLLSMGVLGCFGLRRFRRKRA